MNLYIEQEPRKVTLNKAQIRDVAIEQLGSMRKGSGIEDHQGGRWIYGWHDSGHGSGFTEHIQIATELDEAVELVWKELLDLRSKSRELK